MEDLNNRRRISFSLYKVECTLQGINSREIRLHLPFSANWNKRDSVWKTGILVKSYVFTAVAVVDAQAPVTLEELCKRIRHCYATLRQARNKRNVGSCWFKSLTSSKLCSITPNHFQPTGCENECKMKDPTMLRPCCAGLWDNSLIAWIILTLFCFGFVSIVDTKNPRERTCIGSQVSLWNRFLRKR